MGRPPKNKPEDVIASFEKRVTKSDGCWEWTGGSSQTEAGYRRAYFYNAELRRVEQAARSAWRLFVGPIPPGLFVCHDCDNPLCVRPDHLFVGTPSDNALDAAAKGRHDPHRKMTAADVVAMRSSSLPHGYFARLHGVTVTAIRLARSGKTYRTVRG